MEAYEAKMQEIDAAEFAVAQHENLIERLTSVHREGGDRIDWSTAASQPEPLEPVKSTAQSEGAARALSTYTPSRLDRIFRREARRRRKLEEEVARAESAEESEYDAALAKHRSARADWEASRGMANRVLAGESGAYEEVIREMGPFAEIGELGSHVTVQIVGPQVLDAEVFVHGNEVVPAQMKTQLKTGKLSVKDMPKGRFNEIHQDYVCGCLLRVARELFALLPVDEVLVTAVDRGLDTSTGHEAERPILSARIRRGELEAINLEAVDPSDALANFDHRMDFKKTKGFKPIERLTAQDRQA